MKSFDEQFPSLKGKQSDLFAGYYLDTIIGEHCLDKLVVVDLLLRLREDGHLGLEGTRVIKAIERELGL